METVARASPPIRARIGLFDATSIIVGVVVGVGIFKTPSLVLANVAGPWEAIGLWALGGFLSLIGALCFAELASTYPRSGGEYVYLTRAYGSFVGFLFAWAQLAVIRTGGGVAALAYVFADYARLFWDAGPAAAVVYAVLAILVLSTINALGVNPGKRTQNCLTVAKVLGFVAIVLAALLSPQARLPPVAHETAGLASFALAMIFVLYTYDGWNEAVYVATEVADRQRTLPLALLLGTAAVTVLYLLINLAYLACLGFEAARSSEGIAADVLALALGPWGGKAMCLLVMVSALGALNGTILTASRIYPELGADHRIFAPLARWDARLGTPVWSLVVQAGISIIMVGTLGIWWEGQDGFDALVKCTAPVFWLFFLLTGTALLVLRARDPDLPRPFRVPLYPLTPLIFCGWCSYMLYGTINYARTEALIGLAVLGAGLPLYLVSTLCSARDRKLGQADANQPGIAQAFGERP
jgi:APA family basic amino acid/polyamine antiporter